MWKALLGYRFKIMHIYRVGKIFSGMVWTNVALRFILDNYLNATTITLLAFYYFLVNIKINLFELKQAINTRIEIYLSESGAGIR